MIASKCIIGLGSPHGDDQIGWLIADEVRLRARGECVVHKICSPLEILDRIDGIEWLAICDACRGTGLPGDWHRWTWPDTQIVQQTFAGSHDIGLATALDLATRLKRLPQTVNVWGVEIERCVPGIDVSGKVRSAITHVVSSMIQAMPG